MRKVQLIALIVLMKFLRCPCCNKLHFTRLNGLLYENPYLTLREFKLKKRIKCGKCHSDIAIFFNEETLKIRVIWEEYHIVYDDAFKKQKELQFEKEEVLKIENNEEKQKQLEIVLKKIQKIQNKVSIAQSKLRIRARVISPDTSHGITERLSYE